LFNLCGLRNRFKPFLFLASVLCVSVLGPGLEAFGQTPTPPSLLPYIVTLLAGGPATSPGANATCPMSGRTSQDKFGDNCLATEVALTAPRFVTQDKLGNIFLSDSGTKSGVGDNIVRRIDATTGIISLVAGGAATNPPTGAACPSGTGSSTDADGDGCLGTDVKLGLPHGLAFSPSGDLYIADNSFATIRQIAATNGVITATGAISTAVGNVGSFGFNVNTYSGTTLTSSVFVGTQTGAATTLSYLNDPSGIVFDQRGDLYIADSTAIEVANLGTSDTTIMGLRVPQGTIAKIVGYGTGVDCTNFISTSSTANKGSCKTGMFTNGNPARSSNVDNAFDVAVDAAGNLYFANEFYNNVGVVNASTGLISTYAGILGTVGKSLARGPASTNPIGSVFSVALDQSGDLYATDASAGVIWRVDATSDQMYVVAGGAKTVCSMVPDAFGDGCPATQATFSGKGIGVFATVASPGIAGVRVDPAGNLLVTDAAASLIRKVSNGTQFGTINGSKPTQMIDVHFGINDGPASASPYTLTAGTTNFVLGAQNCTVNTDNTTDCVLPVQATPSIPGAFTATLAALSKNGMTSSFTLGGTFSPVAAASVTTLAVSTANGCSGTTVAVGSQVTITSTSTGPAGTPTGTVTFFNGTTQIGTPQTLSSTGQASVTTTLSTAGTPSITAVYSGDPFFLTSTSAPSTLTLTNPSFSTALNSQQLNTITAGQSALFSFTVASNVYTGNINFACTGLPANSACTFSPSTMVETGCSNSQTVTLTIATTQPTPVKQSTFAASPFGRGPWAAFGMLPGLVLAFLITLRRRKNRSMKYGQIWLAMALLLVASGASACGSGTQSTPGTPTGTSTVTVTAADAGGNSKPLNVTLIVQ
jgi:Bacterial Ig-like domain (group 3)